MNRLCLLALLALTTGACAKERTLSKTPQPAASKEKKGEEERDPNTLTHDLFDQKRD